MIDRLKRSAPVAILVILVTLIVACGEQVSGTLGCPQLCTNESALLKDTTLIAAIAIDTSLYGYPALGDTRDITMLNRGDTADVRLVARFDTLPTRYVPSTAIADSSIVRVDSAAIVFYIDTVTTRPTFPITVEAYDVDTTSADTLRSALVPLFRPSRLIGSKTYQQSDIKDTMSLPLNNDTVLAKIRDSLHLRVGLKVSGGASAQMRVLASTVLPRLRFRVSADTTVKPDTVFPISGSPPDDQYVLSALTVFPVVAAGALPQAPQTRLIVGGLAGARTYFRFSIPHLLLDSVQVVRASLLLNQMPGRSTARTGDTLTLFTHPVLSAPSVIDIRTQGTFIGSPTTYGVDSLRLAANDTGPKSVELVNLFRFWKSVGDSNSTRAIVLRAGEEGNIPGELDFSSLENLAALRPRLRITYVPRHGFGLP